MSGVVVGSPVPGTALAMSEVPDPVFAESIVGPGVAVDPPRDGDVDVVAPFEGTLVKLHPHAFVVQHASGRAVLVHLGLDTVQLKGEGFTLHAAEGERVTAGQVLVTWRPGDIAEGGRSPVSPVVALDTAPGALSALVEPGTTLETGAALFEWA